MVELIPIWFYGISSLIYFASFLIGISISYFAWRLYRVGSNKQHRNLSWAFLILSSGLFILGFSSLFNYFYIPYFRDLGVSLNRVTDLGFASYYFASFISYILFLLVYFPRKIKARNYIVFVPLKYASFELFHVISIIIMSFVSLQVLKNYNVGRNFNSLLVAVAFILIGIFHLTLLLIPFSPTLYLAANSFLALGFLSFLIMLIRVRRR